MQATPENIENFRLRTATNEKTSFLFKKEVKPGVLKFKTIELNKKYIINNPNLKVNGRVLETLNFIYPLRSNIEETTPLGIEVKYLCNNKNGTYYDVFDLEEVE